MTETDTQATTFTQPHLYTLIIARHVCDCKSWDRITDWKMTHFTSEPKPSDIMDLRHAPKPVCKPWHTSALWELIIRKSCHVSMFWFDQCPFCCHVGGQFCAIYWSQSPEGALKILASLRKDWCFAHYMDSGVLTAGPERWTWSTCRGVQFIIKCSKMSISKVWSQQIFFWSLRFDGNSNQGDAWWCKQLHI